MSRPITVLVVAVSVLALGACAKKQRIEDLPPPSRGTGGTAGIAGNSGTTGPARAVPGSQQDFVASVAADRIFFDSDAFDVDSEDQATLQSQAKWLARYPNVRVSVEGHCDERGTRDYNLALGERRANAAKNFLIGLGVSAARITTISYGKERPDALGSDEGAWARNRRAVSVTVR
jgi:peptidoglycan-associated lipoprotein